MKRGEVFRKASSKDRDIQKEKEQKFLDQLDELYDIAHENAMSLIKIEEDQFLKQQRQKGRPGYMCGIDQDLLKREQKSYERAERMENHKKRQLQEMTDLSERVELECSTSGSELGDDEDVGRCLISTGLEQNFEKEEDAAEKLCWKPESENDEEQIFQKKNRLEYSAIEDVVKKGVYQFVRPESKKNFVRFGIDPAFLEKEVGEWSNDEEYKRAKKIATKIKVTNDTAERGVKLMEYNGKLSMKEEQKQYTLQVVSNYRKLYPDSKKETLVKRL